MGYLAGTWRSSRVSVASLKVSGGAAGVLTVGESGAFTADYGGIQPMKFSDDGLAGTMQYRGKVTGQLHASGNKLTGTTSSSTFRVRSQVNGTSFSLPLPKVAAGTTVPWLSYTCSGNSLTLITAPPASTWYLTRTS